MLFSRNKKGGKKGAFLFACFLFVFAFLPKKGRKVRTKRKDKCCDLARKTILNEFIFYFICLFK